MNKLIFAILTIMATTAQAADKPVLEGMGQVMALQSMHDVPKSMKEQMIQVCHERRGVDAAECAADSKEPIFAATEFAAGIVLNSLLTPEQSANISKGDFLVVREDPKKANSEVMEKLDSAKCEWKYYLKGLGGGRVQCGSTEEMKANGWVNDFAIWRRYPTNTQTASIQ